MQFHRLLPLCLVVIGLWLAGCAETDPELDTPIRLEGEIFGTFYQVSLAESLRQSDLDLLEAGIRDTLEDVDAAMSTYRDDAELMALNRTPVGQWKTLSAELTEVLAISEAVARQSGGAFDITIGGVVNLWSFGPEARPREVPEPDEIEARLGEIGLDKVELDVERSRARRMSDVFIDLSAVAKGYATDRLMALLDDHGFSHYLVNIGGELAVSGYRDGQQSPWRVGVEVPDGSRQVARHVLPLHDMTVATSGDYRNYFEQDGERYSHTIDPRNGYPIRHPLASVSVLHPSNAWADAWATALLVLGPEQAMAKAREQSLRVMTLVREGDGWVSEVSPAFVEYFGAEALSDMHVALPSETSDDTNADRNKES
ncbi:FAD:protein FMN transferase [Litchfieldella xinjiangensis]|uniref:FAD:protein FMN transferase n=1 Tax=Litchfieldella xinjiangensis TaxID=1166948 RepID=UPI0006945492|nr:FAD:protein FMN transferase [Halomonas xinjiangensis]